MDELDAASQAASVSGRTMVTFLPILGFVNDIFHTAAPQRRAQHAFRTGPMRDAPSRYET
jgi:hypothetical protein